MIKLFWNTHNQKKPNPNKPNDQDARDYIWGIYHKDNSDRWIHEILGKIHGAKIIPEYKNFSKPGTKRRVPDITKLKKLGYTPLVTLDEGLKKTYDWYANYYRNKNHN